ncbi:MAG: sugar nucleotide-binding protein, partial [Pseudomonadota bacterium]
MMLEPGEILVTGGDGRLGKALAALGCRALSREILDITDEAALVTQIAAGDARCIINAAAYTAVDAAETDQTRAEQVNSFGAGCVARAAAQRGIPCIHISTDCVFGDGDPAT